MDRKSEKAPKNRLKDMAGIAALVVGVLSARSSLADHYTVPTGSMVPNIHIGDRILVNKAAYGIRLPMTELYLFRYDKPARDQIVVFPSPVDGKTLVKRIVGLPGDEIQVSGGKTYLNGKPFKHPYPLGLSNGGGPPYGPKKIPPEHYLMMGDNRGNSLDGRVFGLVSANAIMGKAVRVYFRDGGFVWQSL